MSKLAVIVLTKNEEKNIADVIANAKGCADEVVIVDSGSTDGTVTMAQALGARVVYRAWDHDFAAQRNFALTQTDADWVLYLDADERMDGEFIKQVKVLVEQNEPQQYLMTRCVVAFNYTFKYGIFAPDQVVRLFPRNAAIWKNKVHEHPESNLPKAIIGGAVLHYTYVGWQQWVDKINQYTTIWAEDNFAQGKKTSSGAAFYHALYGFIRAYILQRGFLDGWMGLYASCQHFFYTMLKYVKLYHLQVVARSSNDGR
ncbi:MAG: glycosyltransferase family 2 protein [Acidaminococcaceae bacterium]